MLLEFTRINP